MSRTDFSKVDLNLLRVLNVLLATKSPTKAGEQLNLTQAAVSNSLRRLRETFGDQILVRNGNHMELTQWAEEIKTPLSEALVQLGKLVMYQAQTLQPNETFPVQLTAPAQLLQSLESFFFPKLKKALPKTPIDIRALNEKSMELFLSNDANVALTFRHLFVPHPTTQKLLTNPQLYSIIDLGPANIPIWVAGMGTSDKADLTLEEFLTRPHVMHSQSFIEDTIDFLITNTHADRKVLYSSTNYHHIAALLKDTEGAAVFPDYVKYIFQRYELDMRPVDWWQPQWHPIIIWNKDSSQARDLESIARLLEEAWREMTQHYATRTNPPTTALYPQFT